MIEEARECDASLCCQRGFVLMGDGSTNNNKTQNERNADKRNTSAVGSIDYYILIGYCVRWSCAYNVQTAMKMLNVL